MKWDRKAAKKGKPWRKGRKKGMEEEGKEKVGEISKGVEGEIKGVTGKQGDGMRKQGTRV